VEQTTTNSQETTVFRDGGPKIVRWEEVRPGDVVKVYNEEFFPCDMILLGVGEARPIASNY